MYGGTRVYSPSMFVRCFCCAQTPRTIWKGVGHIQSLTPVAFIVGYTVHVPGMLRRVLRLVHRRACTVYIENTYHNSLILNHAELILRYLQHCNSVL